MALTTPYMDAGGAGVVITAAHTLYYGKANHAHTTNDQVIGVMGADFPLPYFHRWAPDIPLFLSISMYFFCYFFFVFFLFSLARRDYGLRDSFCNFIYR